MKAILLLAVLHIMIAYQSGKKKRPPRKEPVIENRVAQKDKATPFSGYSFGFTWHIYNNPPVTLPHRNWNYLYGSRL